MQVKIHEELEKHIWPLKPEEYKLLEQSILDDGIRDKLVTWQGYIVDGHNRYKIAKEHGLTFETIEKEFADIEAVKDWMDANQLARRNLTRDQWEITIGRRYNREKKIQGSNNQYTQAKSEKGQIDTFQTADRLAAEYQVSAPTVKRYAKKAEEFERLRADLPEDDFKAIANGEKTIKEAWRELKNEKRQQARQELAQTGADVPLSERWNIYHGDIAAIKLDKQYDFIITDPPYPKEYLPLWETLAIRSKEFLKPGGLLIAMSGQLYLNQIYAILDRHLSYYWTACYLTLHQPTPLRTRNVNTTWKPILIYGLDEKYEGKIFGDVYQSPQPEKTNHDWGQSVEGMYALVKQICLPGQSILDPFCGSGTTLVAGLRHGCIVGGIDVDIESVNISKARLNDEETF